MIPFEVEKAWSNICRCEECSGKIKQLSSAQFQARGDFEMKRVAEREADQMSRVMSAVASCTKMRPLKPNRLFLDSTRVCLCYCSDSLGSFDWTQGESKEET